MTTPSSSSSTSASMDTSDEIRLKSRSLFSTSLSTGLSSLNPPIELSPSSPQLQALSTRVETAIFDSFDGDSGNAYRDAIRQKSLLLKKNHPEVGKRLVEGGMRVEEFAEASTNDLQTPTQFLSDARLAQDNLQQSLGMANNFGNEVGAVDPPRPVSPSQEERSSGFVGVAEEMMGGEGEFASRKQPKVGKAMEGIEFETP